MALEDKSAPLMLSRRKALQTTAMFAATVTGSALFMSRKSWSAPVSVLTIADPRFSKPVIDPGSIPKFVDALPVPGATWPLVNAGSQIIKVILANVEILPVATGLKTPVWCYRGALNYTNTFLGPTLQTTTRTPANITFDFSSVPTTAVLQNGSNNGSVVDKHIHGSSMGEPDVRFITHMHGAVGIDPKNDGYPEAWVTPSGGRNTMMPTVPGTLPASVGAKQTHVYPNRQRSALSWYHDHTLALTRLNVYAGLAAGLIISDPTEQGYITKKQLPDLGIPLIIQDRMFYPDGRLAYPDMPSDASGCPTAWPVNDVSTLPEFFGDVILVNGKSWPFMDVDPKVYRFRFLNGCNSRVLKLSFKEVVLPFQIIGTEAGFLPSASVIRNSIIVGGAERFDVLIDFSKMKAGQLLTLVNSANKPFPDGDPVTSNVDDQVMQFRVSKNAPSPALASPPARWNPTNPTPFNNVVRRVLLSEGQDEYGRIMPMLGVVTSAGANVFTGQAKAWHDPVTETPRSGTCEVWEVYNTTVDAHPVHLHECSMRVLSRQPITFDPSTQTCGSPPLINNIKLTGSQRPGEAYEVGFKDTVLCYPGEVTRIATDFTASKPGRYVWHCHILEHEDHDMMRPFDVI